MTSKGKQDLDEYIFARPEMSKLLGISTNALRCRMRKGRCDLEYRFDGKKFMFKRPRADRLPGPLKSTPKLPLETSHDKTLREYDRRVQKRYQRGGGSTHADHGGKPSRKGKYTQQSFKHHNELKLLNSLQGKYQNDAQRREFENMNEEALKEADRRARKKAEIPLGQYHDRPKYGGMIRGYSGPQWDRPYDLDNPKPPTTSFHITGKPYGELGARTEKKEKIEYTWYEPRRVDPGADYKPGKFKHLDEAIRNTKKD